MSTTDDRLAIILQNYRDASDNEPYDLSKASSPSDVASIQANVWTARETYYAAVASELSNNGSSVENAYDTAKAAQKSVSEARSRAESIPALINKLKASTSAATDLLNVAKKLS